MSWLTVAVLMVGLLLVGTLQNIAGAITKLAEAVAGQRNLAGRWPTGMN